MSEARIPVSRNPIAARPSQRASWLRPKYVLFGFLALMFAYVLVHDESFLVNAKDPEWPHIQTFKWWLLPHGIAGACAILLAPMQFSDRLRQRFTKLHRILGRIYCGGVLIAAPLGVVVQHANEALGFARSFTLETVLQGGVWLLTTAIALAFILKGKVQQHRQWMTRSFAAGPFVFMEVRVIGGITGWENLGPHVIEIIVWACTGSAIILADLVLQGQELLRNRSGQSHIRNKSHLDRSAAEAPALGD